MRLALGASGMSRETTVFGVSVLAVVVGLGVLLFGEFIHDRTLVVGGGVVVLVGCGIMTRYVAGLPDTDHS